MDMGDEDQCTSLLANALMPEKMGSEGRGKLGEDSVSMAVQSCLRSEVALTRSCLSSCFPHSWKWAVLTVVLTLLTYTILVGDNHISIVISNAAVAPIPLLNTTAPMPIEKTISADTPDPASLSTLARLLSLLNHSVTELVQKDFSPPPPPPPPLPVIPIDPTPRFTIEEWMAKVDELPFLLEYGVDTNSLARARSRRVSQHSVDLLHEHVQSHRLVEGWDNLLFIGVVNFGYIDMAYSWICFMQRLGTDELPPGRCGRGITGGAHSTGLRLPRYQPALPPSGHRLVGLWGQRHSRVPHPLLQQANTGQVAAGVDCPVCRV